MPPLELSDRLADSDSVRGEMRLVLRGPHGKVKARRTVKNLIVTVGRNQIADQLLAAPTITKPTHMGIGTGVTVPAAGDTALGTQIDRNALTSKTRSTNVVTMVGDWAAGDGTNAAITEAGIFNAATAGDMSSRATFTAIDKQAADTLSITWTFTIGT
ncbi:MAG: hypothetical protein ACRDY6_13680 [Acidimicrobiia bacterium]